MRFFPAGAFSVPPAPAPAPTPGRSDPTVSHRQPGGARIVWVPVWPILPIPSRRLR